MGNYKFVNPYNFVPLGKGPERKKFDDNKGNLSGVIEYSIRTRTPLFIPNTSNEYAIYPSKKNSGHKSYEFFSYTDLSGKTENKQGELPKPIIPGSEMRGMLRSYYEILTDSCMSAIDTNVTIKKKEHDLEQNIADYFPCKQKDNVCPSCRLFGMVDLDSVTSRIRVTDLTCKNRDGKWYGKATTLAILSSPKSSSAEFYLKRPADNAVFWTYDHYIDDNEKRHNKAVQINGRKFYWNHDVKKEQQSIATKLNISIRPVKEGIDFEGKIYFTNLTNEELDGLCYLLKQDENHAYKLGAAKPLGYGSITVTLKEVRIQQYSMDLKEKTVRSDTKTYEYKEKDQKGWKKKDIIQMTTFNNDDNIDYPRLNENGKIFEWFSANRTGNKFIEYMKAMSSELEQVCKDM